MTEYDQNGPSHSAENRLAASAVGLFAGLSEDNLIKLRKDSNGRNDTPHVLVWRQALRDLLLTLESTHPGFIDHVRRR